MTLQWLSQVISFKITVAEYLKMSFSFDFQMHENNQAGPHCLKLQ